MFIAPPFIIARTWKQPCPLTDEWIKTWCKYVYMYIYTHTYIKRNETNLIVIWMDLESVRVK